MTTNEIKEEIRGYAATGYLPQTATTEALVEMARRWVKAENHKVEREAVRALEAVASTRTTPQNQTVGKMRQIALAIVSTATQEWGDILDLRFNLPTGETTTWGTASAEQHEQRADALEYSAAGAISTSARHRLAAQELRQAGAQTLKDLP